MRPKPCIGRINSRYNQWLTVAVAQLVESRIVIPVVVGSSPISHPTDIKIPAPGGYFFAC
jgi:hypothetical protein